jgi:hypothetical protein
MTASVKGRGTAVLAITGALVIAALAMAAQSQASTIYACVKKSGSPRIISKKVKCHKGEKRLSWSSQGPAGKNGAAGATGGTGAKGETGPAATTLWAVVEFNGTLVRGGTGAVSSTSIAISPAHYIVTFNRDVTKCAYVATPAATAATTLPPVGFDSVAPAEGNPDGVFVKTETSGGAEQQESFDLAVFC